MKSNGIERKMVRGGVGVASALALALTLPLRGEAWHAVEWRGVEGGVAWRGVAGHTDKNKYYI